MWLIATKVTGLLSDETRKKQMTKKVYLIDYHFFPLHFTLFFCALQCKVYTFSQCLKSFLTMSNTLFSRFLTLWLLLRKTFPQYLTLFFHCLTLVWHFGCCAASSDQGCDPFRPLRLSGNESVHKEGGAWGQNMAGQLCFFFFLDMAIFQGRYFATLVFL